jgi:hypothetical protein
MTTTVATWKTSGNANGVAPIPFSFQAISSAEVGVRRAGAEQVGGFTVALNGDGTGSVTPTSSWGTDAVVIYSKPNYSQPANFTRFGAFYPDQFNPPLDRAARTELALKGAVEQAIAFPNEEVGYTLPAPVARRKGILGFADTVAALPLIYTIAGIASLLAPELTAIGYGKGDPGSPGEGYSTRAAMAAAPVTLLDDAYLTEAGRYGKFIAKPYATYATAVAGDLTQQGQFVRSTSDPTLVWVRVETLYGLPVIFDWWGAVPGDWTTGVSPDCLANFTAMQAAFDAMDRNVSAAFVANAPRVRFPGAQYCFSDKVVFNRAMEWVPSTSGQSGGEGTFLRWTAGIGGIVINRGGSTYAGEVSASTGGAGSKIGPGFTFQGPGGNSTGVLLTDLLYSAIRIKDVCDVSGNVFRNWRGAGVCASASTSAGAGDPFFGNINGAIIHNNFAQSCKSGGIYVSGGDGNVLQVTSNRVDLCGRYGVFASPFLSTWLANNQVAHCGYPSASGVTEYSMVHNAGRRYQARFNATLAQLQGTTPGTNELIWMDIGASGGASPDVPQWTALLNYVPGGVFGGTGAFCTGINNYFETGGQVPDMPGVLEVGGFFASGSGPTPQLFADTSGIGSNKPLYQAKNYIDASFVKARLGGPHSANFFDLLGWNSSSATGGFDSGRFYGLVIHKATNDLLFATSGDSPYVETGTPTPVRLATATTSRSYGGLTGAEAAGTLEVQQLAVGIGDNARLITSAAAAPTSGNVGRGQIILNNTPSAAGKAGWIVTTAGVAGSTAVIKPFAAIDA